MQYGKAKRYSSITEVTPEILRLFVEKIMVGEKSKEYSRTAEQDICIYYRDIGLMVTPAEPPNEQEIAWNEGEGILTGEAPEAACDALTTAPNPAA